MIDVYFDVQTDTPAGKDPDFYSPTLREYHRLLWSKPLPNGENLVLTKEKYGVYLKGNGINFGGDNILISFRYYDKLMDQVRATVPDYDAYMKDFFHKTYTIGSAIIFPMHRMSLNQRRGMHPRIKDRFDLTLECIRRFYNGEDNPLQKGLEIDKEFFDWFVDFKGYVDFFLLNDMVSEDYKTVKCWCGDLTMQKSAIPKTIDDYWSLVHNELEFLEKRKQRIIDYCKLNNL